MKEIIKIWRLVLLTAIVAIVGVVVWMVLDARRGRGEQETIEVKPARMVDMREVANLCGMEIYREETVLDTIHGKVIFAIWKIQGRILFDVEGLPSQLKVGEDNQGDTIHIRLPKERVELLESTAPGSWRVVDTRNLSLFGSGSLTPEEENAVKRRALARVRKSLYTDGTVGRARTEASATITRLLTPLLSCPILVDP